MPNILMIGANSAIARALSRRYADRGCTLYLLGRKQDALLAQQQDLRLRGASEVHCQVLDVNDDEGRSAVLQQARNTLGHIDVAVLCHGTLPDQRQVAHDWKQIHPQLQTNALSSIAMLCELAPMMRDQKTGTMAVLTSVAGDRGRASNYVYGAAKSMVTRYLQGLRAELTGSGVQVLEVRPGFVDTPMTADFDKGLLWSSPQRIAGIIDRAVQRRRNLVYAPGFWRLIMLVIRCIPEPLFKRLKL